MSRCIDRQCRDLKKKNYDLLSFDLRSIKVTVLEKSLPQLLDTTVTRAMKANKWCYKMATDLVYAISALKFHTKDLQKKILKRLRNAGLLYTYHWPWTVIALKQQTKMNICPTSEEDIYHLGQVKKMSNSLWMDRRPYSTIGSSVWRQAADFFTYIYQTTYSVLQEETRGYTEYMLFWSYLLLLTAILKQNRWKFCWKVSKLLQVTFGQNKVSKSNELNIFL